MYPYHPHPSHFDEKKFFTAEKRQSTERLDAVSAKDSGGFFAHCGYSTLGQ